MGKVCRRLLRNFAGMWWMAPDGLADFGTDDTGFAHEVDSISDFGGNHS